MGSVVKSRPTEQGAYEFIPIQGLNISIAGRESKTVSTDAEGKFRVNGLKPGTYTVSAQAPQQYAPFRAYQLTLHDRSCAQVNWTTTLDGHIRGYVYFADGNPAASLVLSVRSVGPNQQASGRLFTSAQDGAFDFGQLPPGSYLLGVNMDFAPVSSNAYFRRAFYPGTADRAQAAEISVGAGEAIDNLRFILPPDLPNRACRSRSQSTASTGNLSLGRK